MTAHPDHDLAPSQWEALKALRRAGAEMRSGERLAVPELVELGLATLEQGRALITAEGRQVLLRGSPRLWDVAA
uniref:Uncharacterized protein n=1 Tax=Rhodopseudomonas palustris (strain BisA53) TaxID=316055 RepID=Q07S80_RHOP5